MQGRMRPPEKNYKPTTADNMYELMNNLIFHQVGLEKALLHSLLECLRLSACFKAKGKTVGNLRA